MFSGLRDAALALHDAGIALTLTTSGFGTESNVTWLLQNASVFARIIISVDGPVPAAHDLLRRMPGSFESLASLISRLQAKGYDRIRVNTVLVAPVLPRYLELVQTISDLKPIEWCLIQPHPANKKPTFELYSLRDESFIKGVSQIATVLEESGSPIRLLRRTVSDYSGYWVLYPDGMLRHHSNTEEDQEAFAFRRDRLAAISTAVRRLGVTVPTSGSGHSVSKE